jgi:uncharacterized membrane protein
MLRHISLIIMALGYIIAGVNHIWHPLFYIRIMPDYFPEKVLLNQLTAVAEFGLGVLLFPKATRRLAAYGIIAMLLVFITVHVWMIQQNSSSVLLWLRLIIGQPLLIWWAWSHRR